MAASLTPSVPAGGTPVVVWEGSIEATGQVMKKAESQHLMHCRLLAKPTTWPPHLEQGWGKVLVSRLQQLHSHAEVQQELHFLQKCCGPSGSMHVDIFFWFFKFLYRHIGIPVCSR